MLSVLIMCFISGHMIEMCQESCCHMVVSARFLSFSFPSDPRVALSMSSFTQLHELRFRPASALVHVGAVLQLELHLCSLMPVPVRVEQLAASVHFAGEQPGTTAQKRAAQNPDGTVTFPAASPVSASPALELCEIQEHSPSDNALNTAGVVCKNMHLLMRRHDSTTSLDTPITAPSALAMDDGAQMLKAHDVTLLPGNNSIVFTAPVRRNI